MRETGFSTIDAIRNFGRGLLMGAADIIPGVSGGTIALILGIYERLVLAISRFDRTLLRHIRRREFAEAARHSDLAFLSSLLVGILSGALLLSGVMHYLLEHQRQHTFGAFFGLILASAWHVKGIVKPWTTVNYALVAVGALFAYILVGLPMLTSPPYTEWYVFLCGVIAICAMILPGISGAFILVILGAYGWLTRSLHEIQQGNLWGDAPIVLACMGAGAVVGLLAFSKFLRWLLSRYEAATMAVLCGFMLGSLRRIWPFKQDLTPQQPKVSLKQFVNQWPDFGTGDVWLTVGIGAAAFALVLGLEWWTRLKRHG